MSTRSLIVKQNQDETYNAIYCHNDGHPYNNGIMLVENYNTPSEVDQLLALGDLSSLNTTLDTTVAYHRDMGRDYEAADYLETFDVLKKFGGECWADYIYIYNKDNEWECYNASMNQITIPKNIVSETEPALN